MKKNKIRVVTTGDSMTASFGEGAPILANALNAKWPEKEFDVINQGVGGTRVGYGLWRLKNEYEWRDKKHPPLISLDPDIVIIESFAYNNATDGFTDDALNHFRDMHRQIVETLQEETNATIIFIATFAPDMDNFLKSVPAYYNTPLSIRHRMAKERMAYLEEAIKVANELNLPLVNAYQRSLDNVKKGIPLASNINPIDWIHPSECGMKLVAQEIVNTLSQGVL